MTTVQRERPAAAVAGDVAGMEPAAVDLVDDGETPAKVPADPQDFIVADRFLEHAARSRSRTRARCPTLRGSRPAEPFEMQPSDRFAW